MKSAESWLEEMFGRGNWVTADTVTLKAIQLDAWRQGMADAHKIAQRYADDEAGSNFAQCAANEIRRELDSKKQI